MKSEVIKEALEPVKKWISGEGYPFDRVVELLEDKLKNTPERLIVSPDGNIAVDAVKYMCYSMENQELRDVYVSLLAAAMNKVARGSVHPAFVQIARELSADEIKFLRHMAISHSIPVLSVVFEKENGEELQVVRDFSVVPKIVGCERENYGDLYIENLIRLGLVCKARPLQKLESSEYEPLKSDPHVVEYSSDKMVQLYGFDKCKLEESYIDLSILGKSFCAVCVGLGL